jgi:hypothetical protein
VFGVQSQTWRTEGSLTHESHFAPEKRGFSLSNFGRAKSFLKSRVSL